MSTCPIRHLLWLSVNGSSWDCTVQRSSPHKCSQKSCCSAFNVMAATFLLDIFAFLSPLNVPKVHPYRWNFLKGHLNCPSTCLTDIHRIWEGYTLRTIFLHPFLTWFSTLGLSQSFTPPQTCPCPRIRPKAQYTNLGSYPSDNILGEKIIALFWFGKELYKKRTLLN